MKVTYIIWPFVILLMFLISIAFATAEPLSVTEIDEKITYTVLQNGDMKAESILIFSAHAFQQFKEKFPILSMFIRLFKPANVSVQIENIDLKVDDLNNKITATFIRKGAATNKGEYWEIGVADEDEKVTLSAQTANSLIFTSVFQDANSKVTTVSTVIFPPEAKNIKFDATTNKITYELPYDAGIRSWIFLGLGIVLLAGAGVNQFYIKY